MTEVAALDDVADALLDLSPDELRALLPTLRPDEVEIVEQLLAEPSVQWQAATNAWRDLGRPDEQLAPPGEWALWLYLAGRGTGKTRAGAEDLSEFARTHPGCRLAMIGRTQADVRDTMVEGESGLRAVIPEAAIDVWNRSTMELVLVNGSQFKGFSSQKPASVRGPQHHRAWIDEPATWFDANKGDAIDTTFNNLMLGMRLGDMPQVVVTGTPKRTKLIRDIIDHPHSVMTRGTTYDNLPNLAPTFRDYILAKYEGTTIGRQELLGHLLEDVEGSLWKLDLIETHRIEFGHQPHMTKIAVAVDPSASEGAAADHTGIVIVGRGEDGHGYALDDRSLLGSPDQRARAAIRAYIDWQADIIVFEANKGGDWVAEVLRNAAKEMAREGELDSAVIPVAPVNASRGKRTRAEPVHQLYEQGRFHHVGSLVELEDEMTSWVPDSDPDSPDRLDALVWGATKIILTGSAPASASAATVAAARLPRLG